MTVGLWQTTTGMGVTRILLETVFLTLFLSLRAKAMRSFESPWSFLEYFHEKRNPAAASYTVHLENKWNNIIQHPNVPSNVSDSPLLKYFKRPSHYQGLLFSWVCGAVRIVENYLTSLQFENDSNPSDIVSAVYFLEHRGSSDDAFPVSRIPFMAQSFLSCSHFFWLCMSTNELIFKQNDLEGRNNSTLRKTSAAIGLSRDENEFEYSLDEAIWMHNSPRLQDGC